MPLPKQKSAIVLWEEIIKDNVSILDWKSTIDNNFNQTISFVVLVSKVENGTINEKQHTFTIKANDRPQVIAQVFQLWEKANEEYQEDIEDEWFGLVVEVLEQLKAEAMNQIGQ